MRMLVAGFTILSLGFGRHADVLAQSATGPSLVADGAPAPNAGATQRFTIASVILGSALIIAAAIHG